MTAPAPRRPSRRQPPAEPESRPERPLLLPIAGLALLAAGLAFEVAGQPIARFGPYIALAVAAVIGFRLLRRFRG